MVSVQIQDQPLSKKYEGIISLLRFYVDDYKYSIVDRISFALSPESAETAVLEALRIMRSLLERSIRVSIKTGEGKVYNLTCCDYGEGSGPGIEGQFLESSKSDLKGKEGYCVPCPSKMPSTQELEDAINELRKDLTLGRKLAILAYGYRRGLEKES
ncbi:MAG: hypothetical protein RMH77_07160 [Sulfolobales archaeon]|nr:hypothetical protein [Sulfolobales archaeon]MCX8186881.1 hypothetical protein [Sulfolobales archaeon]MDW7970157.1 hypothetical protein [Sulfolobales archaeon]